MRFFLLVYILLTYQYAYSQQKPMYFRHLSLREGLSQSSVHSIIQDHESFLWVSTSDGLNRYDGSNFKVFRHIPEDSTSIPNGLIYALIEDSKKNLFLGTYGGGMAIFNRTNEKAIRFTHNPSDSLSLSDNHVSAFLEDKQGNFWVATWGGGLNLMNRENNTFKHFKHQQGNTESISSNIIKTIYEDKQGNLWIGTYGGGLCLMNKEKGTFTTFKPKPEDKNSLSNAFIFAIYEDKDENFWIGTDGGGICLMDRKTGTFKSFQQDLTQSQGISSNRIRAILEDSKGNFWIGTHGNGLDLFDKKTGIFHHYYTKNEQSYSLSDNSVRCIFEDNQKNVWSGTWSGGLNLLDYKTSYFIRIEGVHTYDGIGSNPNSLNFSVIRGICEDKEGNLWIGTEGGGLNFMNRKTNLFKHFIEDKNKPNSIGSNRIWDILADEHENLWIATDGGGLNYFDRKANRFTKYLPNPQKPKESLGSTRMGCLLIDYQGFLWIGTDMGLSKLDRQTMHFETFRYDEKDSESLGNNDIGSLFEDSQQNLWIGTEGGGLNLFDSKTKKFKRYQHQKNNKFSISNDKVYDIYEDEKSKIFWVATDIGLNAFDKDAEKFYYLNTNDGLPNNVIYGILPDKNGNLWLSTNKGLSRFTLPKNIDELIRLKSTKLINKSFKNYEIKDGLLNDEFSHNSNCILKTGELAFGGVNGINIFHPDSIKENPYIPLVHLLNLKINNVSIPIGEKSLLKQDLRYTKQLRLTSKQNNILIEYVAINFTLSERNQYAYILEGYDKDWKYVNNRQIAEYTNLPFGTFTFKVKASNNDGIWNETPSTIQISITPPFWQTLWFRIAAILLILALVVSIYKWRVRELKNQKLVLEEQVRKRTDEIIRKNEEIEKQKNELILSKRELEELNNEVITQNEELIQSREEVMAQRDAIAQKSKKLEELNNEIVTQNEELHQNQEEIQAQRDYIQEKNHQLEAARELIENQNFQLKESNALLEKKVQSRTKELHQAYQEMSRANKDLDHYIYRSAHDIKGPIARILGLSQLGKLEGYISPQIGLTYLDKIEDCSRELDRMLTKIVQTHELKTKLLHIEEVDLYSLVWSILMDISSSEDISGLQLTTDLTVDKMYTDTLLLKTMLRNVILNAVQYRDKKKRNSYVRVATKIEGDKVIFTVKDNGIGVTHNIVKKIYDMFFKGTELSKGFGLGLYEAKIIAKKLKGQICLNVNDIQETEFQMDVPVNLNKSIKVLEKDKTQP
jgi:ligand-binding sensor domain-containing protein/signal transduction histidine kinase